MKTDKQKRISYAIIIVSLLLVAGLGSLFVNLGMDWFNNLNKPSQFVPNVLIPIMWSIIYIIFGVVLCLWTSKKMLSKETLVLLILNGIFNILWCLMFFAFNLTFVGFVVIVLLLILSWALILNIKTHNNLYFYLTLIYPGWVSIATGLNIALWILN